jgi:hypothetical protein
MLLRISTSHKMYLLQWSVTFICDMIRFAFNQIQIKLIFLYNVMSVLLLTCFVNSVIYDTGVYYVCEKYICVCDKQTSWILIRSERTQKLKNTPYLNRPRPCTHILSVHNIGTIVGCDVHWRLKLVKFISSWNLHNTRGQSINNSRHRFRLLYVLTGFGS